MTVATDFKAIWDFEQGEKETIRECNLCGDYRDRLFWDEPKLPLDDRYGYRVAPRACWTCGLVYLSRRPTREAYARFYETAYRPLVSAFHGREINAQTIQPEQYEYGRRVGWYLDGPGPLMANTFLDIGGSTGVVAKAIASLNDADIITVLDPSEAELAEANKRGVETILGTIETFDAKGRTWDLITLCQTADHLLDLMGSLKKIRTLLSADGLFWSDIVDFNVTREVKIDHPFNLTESTYRKFLEKAGFKLLQVNYQPDGVHIGFLTRTA